VTVFSASGVTMAVIIQADHDPRHPSYIAAQAPVKDSAADFWQLVWEQGDFFTNNQLKQN